MIYTRTYIAKRRPLARKNTPKPMRKLSIDNLLRGRGGRFVSFVAEAFPEIPGETLAALQNFYVCKYR